jgi:hypothetical protein
MDGAFYRLRRKQESVTLMPERFDISRNARRVCQREPQLADYRADALVEVDESVVAPEFLYDLGARDDLPRALEQESQNTERLRLKLYANARSPQLSRRQIGFKYPEANDSGDLIFHNQNSFRRKPCPDWAAGGVLRIMHGGRSSVLQ